MPGPNEDPFSDVRNDVRGRGFGALDGDAAHTHHTARVERAKDGSGMAYLVSCDNCGTQNAMTVTWDEFLYGMHGVTAPQWVYDPAAGGFYPNVGCVYCRALNKVVFTPDECSRQVKAGVAARSISDAYVASARTKLAAAAAAQRGR